jgi:hypothetical protein
MINRFFVLPVPASYFRQGAKDFVVIDDASWGNPAHASVLLSSPCPDRKARLYRNQLMENLPKYVDVEKVFNSSEKFGHIVGTVKQLFAYARWYLGILKFELNGETSSVLLIPIKCQAQTLPVLSRVNAK